MTAAPAIHGIDPEVLNRALDLARELDLHRRRNRLEYEYADTHANGHDGGPYDYQLEFHEAGKDHPERAALWANQIGKSRTAAAEVAIHATGLYPKWWTGHRFDGPIVACVASVSNEKTRDVCQKELFGEVTGEEGRKRPDGTGWVPHELIGDVSFRPGLSDVMDTVRVRHVSGQWSTILLKSYEQGDTKFQGDKWDLGWFDEEPRDYRIYTEGLTRLLVRNGRMMFTRTPLFGRTEVINRFTSGTVGTWWSNKTWEDAPHMTRAIIDRMLESYPRHERETRMKGIPMMGSGGVYPVPEDLIVIPPFEIPAHYRRICGVDFGIDHPAAASWLAYDADTDVIYLYDCYKQSGQTAAYHGAAIKARGDWIPVSWPHDGMARDKGSGKPLRDQYAAQGVNMLPIPARWSDQKGVAAQSREAGSMELLERMNTGRFKVFSHCAPFLEEIRMLHREDGKIVAEHDDVESATRYALMMLRCAVSKREIDMPKPRVTDDARYDPLAIFSGAAA